MNDAPPIAISVGDPAGVGPVVSLTAAYAARATTRCALFGDLEQLREEAERLGCDSALLVEHDESSLADLPAGALALIDTGRVSVEARNKHAPSPEAGRAQLRTLDRAAHAVRAGLARALVTGPTSKAAISSGGHPFVGQTEFLARLDGRHDEAVTMLFLGPKLRVALVTTHLALTAVPQAISEAKVMRTTLHLAQALLRLDPARVHKIALSGLNPHAGELGLFGREEITVLEPAIARLREQSPFLDKLVTVDGPVPAEAIFRAAQRGDLDGVVAMYHDQATIASKLLDWGAAVNTTWGLSFVRTSVDHGVAYDAARARSADADGMKAALAMAERLTATQPRTPKHA